MSLKYEPSSEPLHTCQCVQNTRRGVQHDADNADPNRCKMVWATSLGTRSCPSRRPSSSTGCLRPCPLAAARCVFKAHRRLYHSTLGLKVIMKKKVSVATVPLGGSTVHPSPSRAAGVSCPRTRLGRGVDPTRPCWRELSFWLVAQPSKSAAHRDKSREWNVSKQKWNLC